jgi:hypothetical protein
VSARKNPVLLRRSPLSGGVNALTNYRRVAHPNDPESYILHAATNGKHDVTADFDALVLEALLDPDSPDIVEILEGCLLGEVLTGVEEKELRAFLDNLIALIERHNETGHGAA